MEHALNPSIWKAEAGRSEFEVSRVYRENFRTARTAKANQKTKPNQNKKRKITNISKPLSISKCGRLKPIVFILSSL